ncbi:hypothetical protein AVEN_198498-1 [Araneus ventricosus]|uniref:Uncharacterized protein n=1 Tax=Araneus ventricosus TaxID=182803 RepID=A0A4Y2JNL6_ARAVE|nr:hypothetical protein AVEN_198498-1 [Araneus ventricosus]
MTASEDFDLMRFYIFSPDLDRPISTSLWRVLPLSADKVLNAVDEAFQSNEELHLDETLWMEITTIRHPTMLAKSAKLFDGQFIVGWLLQQGTSSNRIPIGSKLMSIRHPSLSIITIASMSFLPMSLSKLPNCFGLSEKKIYFPHLFNVHEEQTHVGPLPNQHFYCTDSMSPFYTSRIHGLECQS